MSLELSKSHVHSIQKYAFLEPLINDKSVITKYGSGNKNYGFDTIRNTLYFDLISHIHKICFDRDKHSYSAGKIISTIIENNQIKRALSNNYGDQNKFDFEISELIDKWEEFNKQPWKDKIINTRNEIVAHALIDFNESGQPRPKGISDIGLTWGDVKSALDKLKPIIELLDSLIRNSGFAYGLLEKQLTRAQQEFWEL